LYSHAPSDGERVRVKGASSRFVGREDIQSLDASRSHEPERKERGCVEDQPQHSRTTNALRLVEDDTAALRFMENGNRDFEPNEIPLNRPPGTFSPTGGERRDEGVGFMGKV
jgi:hypothetical protein